MTWIYVIRLGGQGRTGKAAAWAPGDDAKVQFSLSSFEKFFGHGRVKLAIVSQRNEGTYIIHMNT